MRVDIKQWVKLILEFTTSVECLDEIATNCLKTLDNLQNNVLIMIGSEKLNHVLSYKQSKFHQWKAVSYRLNKSELFLPYAWGEPPQHGDNNYGTVKRGGCV